METIAKKPRLEWLDAMRGFTMILVVANHVSQTGFMQAVKFSSSLSFLILFRMPLFFFISGFLAYKASQVWDLPNLCRLVGKKLRIQIIPTVVFFFFGMAVLFDDFVDAVILKFHSPLKGGYWFTIALLYMFIIYYLFSYLESKLRWKSWIPITLLFLVSLGVYETCYLPHEFWWAFGRRGVKPSTFLDDSCLIQVMLYMPFFLYGNIVHRYWEKWQRVMDSRWFFPLLVIMVILCTMDSLKWHQLRMQWAVVPLTLAKFSLLTIVFMYFRYYHQYFTKRTVTGRSLQYIGRRTLDIYLIHYLFLPNLPGIGTFFKINQHNFAIDLTLAVLIALLVIGFSCVTSNILRISPFFKKYLFGRS
jgi:fucose 4-O-acetylase-like acetyltransferase